MKSRVLLGAASALALAGPAMAQRSTDNAVTAAEDAFGTSIGNETIGLYGPSQVRGFSPVTAGNVRIEGVYLDRQGYIANRLVSGSTVRVGLSAQGYLFPAPTGIVDYRLRDVGDTPMVSVVAGSMAYGAPTLEVDAQLPIDGRRLGVAAGASYAHEEYYDGSDAHYVRLAVIPRWRPNDSVEVIPFWSTTIGKDEEVAPTILTAGAYAPREVPRRRYFGQPWAAKDSRSVNAGVIGKARIGEDWSLVAGVLRSTFENEQNFAQLFLDVDRDGVGTERVIADPGQRYASTSGELRLSRSFTEGDRLHTLHATLRARSLDSDYGGAAAPIDEANVRVGVYAPLARPASFSFGQRTHDRVRQTTAGLAYEGRWKGVGEASLGVQRADYEKTILVPGSGPTTAADQPWLLNAAAAAHLNQKVALYAGYTRGLEESGLAPNNAANRNEALPAIRTRQLDAGVRWTVSAKLKLVAGVFDVRKPYFNTDETNAFVVLGDVRHRGAEFSLTGSPTKDLSVVAGAVLMQPRVTGEAVEQGRVGKIPLGQPERILRVNLEYRPPIWPGFAVDLAIANYGERAASRDNAVFLEGYTLVDLGARYRFKVADNPAMLRVQIANLTDAYVWSVAGSNSYGLQDRRRVTATLAVDF
ncbi:TonB-dependent receptor [Caulobacter sp. 73W]|uniref:TonB-dependent receptor n=1 Tax=Caulobacter sp. 73W TaxID=3161137 RepID=A0AB39KWL0_9CAUL